MKIGSRVVDSSGATGTITGFRQHPYQREFQEAEIEFDNPQDGALYNHRAVSALHELKGQEPLVDVLNELYQKAHKAYENAGYSGNEYAQNAWGSQLSILKTIAARVLNSSLTKEPTNAQAKEQP